MSDDSLRQIYEDMEAMSRATTQERVADLDKQSAELKSKQAGLAKMKASLHEGSPAQVARVLDQILATDRQVLAELVLIRKLLEG